MQKDLFRSHDDMLKGGKDLGDLSQCPACPKHCATGATCHMPFMPMGGVMVGAASASHVHVVPGLSKALRYMPFISSGGAVIERLLLHLLKVTCQPHAFLCKVGRQDDLESQQLYWIFDDLCA